LYLGPYQLDPPPASSSGRFQFPAETANSRAPTYILGRDVKKYLAMSLEACTYITVTLISTRSSRIIYMYSMLIESYIGNRQGRNIYTGFLWFLVFGVARHHLRTVHELI